MRDVVRSVSHCYLGSE